MTDRLPKSNRTNLTDTRNVTFSQALEAGLTHYDYLDGRKTGRSGREAALVSHSVSPDKAKELKTKRHLWPAFRWLIAQKRPATIFGEQVASSDGREWLSGVRLDLETMGYEVGAADLCAAGVGAPHIRQRLFWVADSKHAQRRPSNTAGNQHNRKNTGRDKNLKHQAESITAGWRRCAGLATP
jgi:site-specific DNA-cytosine methylase